MQRHSENGQKVAEFFRKHPRVNAVHYPGLSSHPFHELAKKQMKSFGGMVSFSCFQAKKGMLFLFRKNKNLTLAESLEGWNLWRIILLQ